ncbi:hypothetical protein CNY89_30145, partial [Amaricoccus sp. HAR-UPW-R2A-40]
MARMVPPGAEAGADLAAFLAMGGSLLAFVLAGAAHRPAMARMVPPGAEAGADLAAFLAMGGSL